MELTTPFISDFLEIVYIFSIIFIGIYCIYIKFNFFKRKYSKMIEEINPYNELNFFREPIVPIITLKNPSEINLSIIISIRNCETHIETIIETISEFFEKKFNNKTYEIIIVNNASTDLTLTKISEISKKIKNIFTIHLKKVESIGFTIITGCIYSRGNHIFIYNPFLGLKIDEINFLDEKLFNLEKINNKSLLIGVWSLNDYIPRQYNSNLSKFISYITSKIWMIFGIEGTSFFRNHYLIMSRELAKKLIPKLISTGLNYEIELIALAGLNNYEVCSFECESSNNFSIKYSSLNRIKELFNLIFYLLFISSGFNRFFLN